VSTGVSGVGKSASLTTGDLSGNGTSVSIGATGAVASIGMSLVSSTGTFLPLNFTSAGTLTQNATNSANVSSYGTISGATAPVLGIGSSASVNATGAVASLSSSSIAGNVSNTAVSTYAPAVSQIVNNGGTSLNPATATITNVGTITTGALSGNGSSVSIGATGAAASISVSSINDTSLTSFAPIGNVTQTVTNRSGGAVNNTGMISVASLAGAGAGASISAVGASASISYRSVK
jgi:hypothetical protein